MSRLTRYTQHLANCEIKNAKADADIITCTCGLDQAIREYETLRVLYSEQVAISRNLGKSVEELETQLSAEHECVEHIKEVCDNYEAELTSLREIAGKMAEALKCIASFEHIETFSLTMEPISAYTQYITDRHGNKLRG